MNPGTLPLPFVSLPPPPTYRYFTAQTPSIIPLACSKETKKPSPSNHLKYPHSRGEREPEGYHYHHHHHHHHPSLPCRISTSSTTTAVPFLPPSGSSLPFAIKSLSLSSPPISHPLFSIVGRRSSSLSRTAFDNCAYAPRTFFVGSRLRIDNYYRDNYYLLFLLAPKAEPYLPHPPASLSAAALCCVCFKFHPEPTLSLFSFPFLSFFFFSKHSLHVILTLGVRLGSKIFQKENL